MSVQERHVLTGVLRVNAQGLFTLEIAGGGVWRLDIGWSWRAPRLIGQQVTVEGTRSEFDMLDVRRIRAYRAAAAANLHG